MTSITKQNINFSKFQLGFFPIPNSQNLSTFSIWYTNIPQSSSPLIWSISTKLNSSSSLVITQKGDLFLNNVSFVNSSNSTQLVLHDNGNQCLDVQLRVKNHVNRAIHYDVRAIHIPQSVVRIVGNGDIPQSIIRCRNWIGVSSKPLN
ncbi:G-type lectin S-receptor serine/threonine-protein kinase [Trifolium repens]|nr:G-type lectin S-receptor serine/threonine-protein kinase [Trifolium repens]